LMLIDDLILCSLQGFFYTVIVFPAVSLDALPPQRFRPERGC